MNLSNSTSTQHTPVESFKWSVKRDAFAFPAFKDGKSWDSWRRSTISNVNAYDVAEVLDPTRAPRSAEDAALFQEKLKFTHSIFNKVL